MCTLTEPKRRKDNLLIFLLGSLQSLKRFRTATKPDVISWESILRREENPRVRLRSTLELSPHTIAIMGGAVDDHSLGILPQ